MANSPVQATLCQEAVSAEWDQGWLLLSRSSLCCSAGAPEKEKLPAREPVTGARGSGQKGLQLFQRSVSMRPAAGVSRPLMHEAR